MKTSYISPPAGLLDITVIKDNDPRVMITLDLGIPNFTVFSLKMPIVQARPADMTALLAEALSALLDEMSAFMLSLGFEEKVIVVVYAMVLATFKEMSPDSVTGTGVAPDDTVITYEGSFKLPMEFVNETYNRVVTAASVIKRVPKQRHIELTVMKPNKVEVEDVGKVIRQYRNRSLKTQPKPMFMLVYDQKGRPAGTIPLGGGFKNNLLKMMKGAVATPQYTEPLVFEREAEMSFKNAVGIPNRIEIAGGSYYPEAFCGDDCALYYNPDNQRYLVKFPDGRVVKFARRPSVRQLKAKNYAIPAPYWRWSLIKEEKEPPVLAPALDNPEMDDVRESERTLTAASDAGEGWVEDAEVEEEIHLPSDLSIENYDHSSGNEHSTGKRDQQDLLDPAAAGKLAITPGSGQGF
jgi:hypothetical protein